MDCVMNREEIVSDLIDGEVILLNLKAGTYYNLENTAATLWQWVEAGASSQAMDTALRAAYPQHSGSQVSEDLQRWLDDLQREALVIPGTASGGSGPAFTCPYEAPRVFAHADMKELLLLDPVHEVGDQGWPTAS